MRKMTKNEERWSSKGEFVYCGALVKGSRVMDTCGLENHNDREDGGIYLLWQSETTLYVQLNMTTWNQNPILSIYCTSFRLLTCYQIVLFTL